MGKAKSGNSNVLKVVSIVAAIVVAVGIIAVFVAPLIPVRKVRDVVPSGIGQYLFRCHPGNCSKRFARRPVHADSEGASKSGHMAAQHSGGAERARPDRCRNGGTKAASL